MEAIIVIDMQKGSFKNTKRLNSKKVIQNINFLTHIFRKFGNIAIFIQHDGTRQNTFIPHTDDWKILDELTVLNSDMIISKSANDAFYNTNLLGYLQDNNISKIYITGCATDYCVNATIHSALTKDLDIIVVSDGHTTANRPMINAKNVVKFHNWLWADLTPTKGKIVVKKTEEIQQLLQPDNANALQVK